MPSSGRLQAAVQGVLFIACLAILGVGIATLVTSVNIQNQNNSRLSPINININGSTNPGNTITNYNTINSYIYNGTVYNSTVYNTTQTVYNTSFVFVEPALAVNVPINPTISQSDPRFSSYQNVISIFKQGLDFSKDPCNNFYEYTCSKFSGDMSFVKSDNQNTLLMKQGLSSDKYRNNQTSKTMKNIFKYYDKCVEAQKNWVKLPEIISGSIVKKVIDTIKSGFSTPSHPEYLKQTQFEFPMLNQSASITDFPTNIGLGYLLGLPLGTWGVSTLVSAYTDTKWENPTKGYRMIIDQPTTFFPNTYYIKNLDNTKKQVTKEIILTMNAYAKTQNIVLNQAQLEKDAGDLADFDSKLALQFSTDDTSRRNYTRSVNLKTLKALNATFPALSWYTFIPFVVQTSNDAMQIVHQDATTFNVMESNQLDKLLKALTATNNQNITPNTLINYIYYTSVRNFRGYLPQDNTQFKLIQRPIAAPKKPRRSGIIPERKQEVSDDDATMICAAETMNLQYANARVLLDQKYPDHDTRGPMREHVAKIANSILVGMRSMIDQLGWMSSTSKAGAYQKIEKLTKNMAYPDFIVNDTLLDAYHATLNFEDDDSYFDLVDKINTFSLYETWQYLNRTSYDRADFAGPPGTTNAWYQDELNSITFPLGILHPPFYDYNWPASVNFGGMGVIAGHELTHGFDDAGVQWDATGVLINWMNDETSKAGFQKMAQCVIDEYSNFCPLNATVYGKSACIDGSQTQGENIADNGGIHAAYRAFKNYVSFNGPDPRLNDPDVGAFSPDQLFFLSFAQVWCEVTRRDDLMQRQILVDVHSPSKYRVFGTIQNFPAFRSAFNCPFNSTYAPDSHCNVWVSDIDSTYGIPN